MAEKAESILEALQSSLRVVVRGDDDALQNVNVKLLRRFRTGAPVHDVRRYALRVARHERAEQQRARRWRARPLDAAAHVAGPQAGQDEWDAKDEQMERLLSAVSQLSPRQRKAILARLMPGARPCNRDHAACYKAFKRLRTLLPAGSD